MSPSALYELTYPSQEERDTSSKIARASDIIFFIKFSFLGKNANNSLLFKLFFSFFVIWIFQAFEFSNLKISSSPPL